MRHASFLFGVILVLAGGASAQMNSGSTFLLGAPTPAFITAEPLPSPLPTAVPADPPQGVYGVFQNFNWQAYGGYTYLRFYELPNLTSNMNGFNLALAYFPKGRNWAADGEFLAAFGSQSGVSTTFTAGLGGARYRVQGPRGLVFWAHGLAGGAHFVPQTVFGGTNAFAFAVGGGADYTPRGRRLGYRLQVDMLGTRFFGTHQYNPTVSVGIVYKF